MKRTTPLKRTGFKRKPKQAGYANYQVDNGFLSPRTLQPLPKLPPIPRKRPKTTAIRKSAKGKPCLIRLPGCDGGGETTVLCHYRLAGYCGTGIKPPDEFGAHGCFSCHQIVDGRAPLPYGYTREAVMLAFCEAVLRTQYLIRMSNGNS